MNDLLSPEFQDLRSKIHEALRAWQNFNSTPGTLLSSLLIVQEAQQSLNNPDPVALRLATNNVLHHHIKELARRNQQAADILTMRFIDGEKIITVANKLNLTEDKVKKQQAAAIDSLTELIRAAEAALRQTRAHSIELTLNPPSYTRLFGVDENRELLVDKLLQEGPPWLLAIVGLGGIGKTSLADQSIRQVIRHFHYDRTIWLRIDAPIVGYERGDNTLAAPFQATLNKLMLQLSLHVCPHLPPEIPPEERNLQVRQTLKAIPHLIVIDNLEFEADSAYLLPLLSDLANPSKFLLTTRTYAPGQTGVFNLLLKELPVEDAADFIRYHAQNINFAELAEANQEQIQSIYDVVGGNPLAIKLVVSLAVVHPLPAVLADLVATQAESIERMYTHIYWHAWQTLSRSARALLEAMPLVAGMGGTLEHIMAISDLSQKEVLLAISELVNRSLLETSGSLADRRYSIHRLTETFLRTEIIHWPEDSL